MKIAEITIHHVAPRFSFVKISTDDGLTGYGEAVVEGRSRTVERAVLDMTPHLIGQDSRRIEHLWQLMYRRTFYRGGPILTSAISGIEQALWDLLGKRLNAPVYQLLGGAVRQRIRVYKHVHGATPEEVAVAARLAVREGFTMVKTAVDIARFLEPPDYIYRQVDKIAAIREAIGPSRDLAVDFHGRLSPALAIRLAQALEPIGLSFIEEPCLPENVDALAAIARSTTTPIATGERLFTKWAFREVLQKQAAAIVQPDLAHCGGIAEAKKIAAMAEAHYAAIAPHNPLGPVNLAASLQLGACTPNFYVQEQVTLGEGLLKQPFEIKDGYIELSDRPGLGVDLDEEALSARAYPGDFDLPREYHSDDGSVADW